MRSRNAALFAVILGVGAVLGACSQDSGSEPVAPDADAPALARTPSAAVCNLDGLSSLVPAYFSPPQQQVVKSLVDAMKGTEPLSPERRTKGYDVLAEMATAAKAGAPPTAGNTLANEIVKCMFDVTVEEDFPVFPVAFTASLDAADGGGFEVRGGAADPAGAVLARRDGAVLAGVAPPPGKTWADALGSQRVLIYGFPVSAGTYDWTIIPRTTNFGPSLAVVTTCFVDEGSQVMLAESGVGVLAYEDAGYICGAPSSAEFGTGPGALLRSLAALILPEPVQATALASTVGGSAGGLRSLFSPSTVGSVRLEFIGRVRDTRVGVPTTAQVRVTLPDGVTTVAGVEITLLGVVNNGNKLELDGETATTGLDGIATFQVVVNKSGALTLVVDTEASQVIGRSGIVTGASSNKFNVRP